MKKMNLKDILLPTLALFLICLIATALLALTNDVTAGTIEENETKTAAESRKEVLPEVDGIAVVTYTEDTALSDAVTYCEGKDESGSTIGYIFTNSAKGYGGDVKVMVGYDLGGTIVGFKVLSASDETPGLGQNSTKEEFWQRFIGKSGTLEVEKNTATKDNSIVAITSATITSKAVVKAVNEATAAYNDLKGGGSNG